MFCVASDWINRWIFSDLSNCAHGSKASMLFDSLQSKSMCASNKVLDRLLNTVWNALPHFFNVKVLAAASDNFCNFPKLAIQHLRPLHATIGQLCRCEKASKILTSLSSSLFSLLSFVTVRLHKPTQHHYCLWGNMVQMCELLSPFEWFFVSRPSVGQAPASSVAITF